mmetsp:Transcript_26037/g.61811  ORF Transcript_26037/g.61811 Transcript_26037/m.61811 type:complete len:80 (+) Transcript_26037:2027-2266(+)
MPTIEFSSQMTQHRVHVFGTTDTLFDQGFAVLQIQGQEGIPHVAKDGFFHNDTVKAAGPGIPILGSLNVSIAGTAQFHK